MIRTRTGTIAITFAGLDIGRSGSRKRFRTATDALPGVYEGLLRGAGSAGRKARRPKDPAREDFYWLADQYYRSPKFRSFDQLTQADKRGVLDRFCQTAGDLPYAALRKEDVEASQDKRRATPAAADKLVKYLRSLFVWAIEKKLATFNPAVGIAKINETEGWHTWTPAEVDIYRSHHEIGSKARLALELMLNVGARISDASRIGRQHEADGWLNFVAWKNRNRKSRKTIQCPITRELAEALAASPTGDMTYLVNDLGRPFTINGLGNKMRDWCDAAGLHQCTAHGLRKAAAVILAESGATAPELCALLRMVQARNCRDLHPPGSPADDGGERIHAS